MLILVHSPTNAHTLAHNLGRAEYSYYFVLKEFRPLLEELGVVIDVNNPEEDVDRIYHAAQRRGLDCVFLSFAPPHRTAGSLACPTIPVFAWEFDSLPDESWSDNWRENWVALLLQVGRAITHSRFTVDVVRDRLGTDYPVVSLPAPVWDRFAHAYRPQREHVVTPPTQLTVHGRVIDTAAFDLAPYTHAARQRNGQADLPGRMGERNRPTQVTLSGVIYTAIFNPNDGRKNFFDMIGGFGAALRDESRATLVVKATSRRSERSMQLMIEIFAMLQPARCRLVLIDGFLSDEEYARLLDISTYALNTSHGEGQCLPMMEYMSAGKPAVSPAHTGMSDYVDERNSFVVRSSLEPCHWPQDPREAYRTRRHRIDFESLLRAYRESFRVATSDGATYRAMAAAAHTTLRAHCSRHVIVPRLRRCLEEALHGRVATGTAATVADGASAPAIPRRDIVLLHAADKPKTPRIEFGGAD